MYTNAISTVELRELWNQINNIIQELDRNIDSMFANVEIAISEADIEKE